jgi:hypothetical protein
MGVEVLGASSIGWLRAVAAGAPVADDDHVASRPTGVGASLAGATNDRRRHHR